MRPDQRWFPTNLTQRTSWFGNFAAKFADIGLDLGFTQADIDAVNADNAVLQFLAATLRQTENYLKAVQAFQKVVTLGDRDNKVHDFPVFEPPNPPANIPTGIFERLERLVRRIRVASNYSESIGAALGIIPRVIRRTDLGETIPKIKTSPAAKGHGFVVRTTRGVFSGFAVQIRRNLSDAWEPSGMFVRSPAEVSVTPRDPRLPEMIDVRIRMLKGNDPVGQYSDIQTVTLVP